jgi:hypothetical protein
MGGGDYKERERACVVSHCHSAGDLDQSCPPPEPPLPYLYLVIISPWESHPSFPVRSPPQSLASLLHSLPRPVLDCPATPCLPPQPGFSSLPVSVDSNFNPLPPPLLPSIYIDLWIS